VCADGAPLLNATTTSFHPNSAVQGTTNDQIYRISHAYDYADRQIGMITLNRLSVHAWQPMAKLPCLKLSGIGSFVMTDEAATTKKEGNFFKILRHWASIWYFEAKNQTSGREFLRPYPFWHRVL